MSAPSVPAEPLTLPELGPSMGRLTEPSLSSPARDSGGIRLDDIRLDLVTAIFELSGAARSFAAVGDRAGAVASLSRAGWLAAWDRAVTTAAGRLTETINTRLKAAAAESRLPPPRLERLLLAPEDTRAVAARLGGGALDLFAALDALEAAAPAASAPGERGRAGWERWREALTAVARRLESAWLALEAARSAEEGRWEPQVARVRSWRRPTWPLWIITLLVLAAAGYLGLLLGGYLAPPGPLRGLVEYWWSRP